MPWVWDDFPTYDLKQKALEEFLTEKFGRYDFYIRVRPSYTGLSAGTNRRIAGSQWVLSILDCATAVNSMHVPAPYRLC
jgi:hypothetical protein